MRNELGIRHAPMFSVLDIVTLMIMTRGKKSDGGLLSDYSML